VALVLTGTDLYRDIRVDADAQRSLVLAKCLVVLQSQGLDELPPELRARTRVIEQSARPLPPLAPRRRSFDLLLVGHLRPEKDPLTAVRALARLDDAAAQCLRLIQVGDTLDAGLAERMRDAARADARIELRGALPHARTRALIRHGRVLLLPSRIEGGANVLIEAVTAGVPVLASRIGGSIGLLGDDYPGLFPVGDDAALAALIRRCRDEPAFLERLRAHCRHRAQRFTPEREGAAVLGLAHNLLPAEHARGAPAPISRNPRR
jgi:putative glycosyltransferase (TIGR04348 family)